MVLVDITLPPSGQPMCFINIHPNNIVRVVILSNADGDQYCIQYQEHPRLQTSQPLNAVIRYLLFTRISITHYIGYNFHIEIYHFSLYSLKEIS